MKRIVAKTIVLFCLLVSPLIIQYINVYAYDSITIRFSNIGDTYSTLPPKENDCVVYGLIVSSRPMIKITDLANIMGATLSYTTNGWYIDKNLQTTLFMNNSTIMYTSNVYQYCTVDGVYTEYDQLWQTTMPIAAQIINGYKYVPLTYAAKQLGALLVEPSGSEYRVYDFRINYSTPLTDSNEYIVGGDWIDDWFANDDDNLSDHFDIDEIYSKPDHEYAGQLKIAVSSLESAERVRYYYNGGQSMTLSCAFRSWDFNHDCGGSVNSFHMRGRAWDCATDALYVSVYNEFRSTHSTPIPVGNPIFYWRSYVPSTGSSRGYEIEAMENYTNKWLHLVRQPGKDTASESP
jgi:hypothetical protein